MTADQPVRAREAVDGPVYAAHGRDHDEVFGGDRIDEERPRGPTGRAGDGSRPSSGRAMCPGGVGAQERCGPATRGWDSAVTRGDAAQITSALVSRTDVPKREHRCDGRRQLKINASRSGRGIMREPVDGASANDVYDVIVIGAGPAGLDVADRARAGGLSVAVVERELVGGECAYWGSVPSKALLRPVSVLGDARRVDGAREAIRGGLDRSGVFGRRDRYVTNWNDAARSRPTSPRSEPTWSAATADWTALAGSASSPPTTGW